MIYAGIGSRETPESVLKAFTILGKYFNYYGHILRSGGADGADLAFQGARTTDDIFIPWKGFNNSLYEFQGIHPDAYNILNSILEPSHISRLSQGALKLHARNVHQILGKDLNTPVDYVICYTTKGLVKGGTATAIKLANKLNIPVINVGSFTNLDTDEIVDRVIQLTNT
jgi:hypothetical protein